MLQGDRLHRIKALLSTFKQVSIERIVQDLGVSRETVRRDVLQLEAEGALARVHGGVVATSLSEAEPPLSVRQVTRAREKRMIARAAARLIQPGQTLLIDAGSTTAALAEELASMTGLTIVTNSFNVALKLARLEPGRSGNEVIQLGGHLNAALSATQGDITVDEIHRYRADLALLSPMGISAQHGATSFERQEAVVARAMVRQARQCVILADHSKIGQSSRLVYAPIAEVDILVTDGRARGLPGLAELQDAGHCDVVVA